MNDKIDIRGLISEISSNSDVQEIKLFADNCCINYCTNITTDIDYLHHFLHDERQTDNEQIEYSMYVTQINPSVKNEFLNCINMNEDNIIHNHILDYHYRHTTIDTQNNAVNIYYSSELIYFILEVGHTYIIMFDKYCDNKTSLPLYIIREIIYRQSENSDFICFHAAACELAQYGIMIIGNPGVGKTGVDVK